MAIRVTSEVRKLRKTKDEKYTATDRFVEVTLRLDTTGGKTSATKGKIEAAVADLAESALVAFEKHKLEVTGVEGSWMFCYGPWYMGEITG